MKDRQREIAVETIRQSCISVVQLDPNTICNNKCWYCPVKYFPYPSETCSVLSVANLDKILQQLSRRDGTNIHGELRWVHTGHYNEILLYPYFEEMLEMFRKYGFWTIIHSNGTNLTKARTRTIKEYPDVIKLVCLNIPSGNEKDYKEFTGRCGGVWEKLIRNIDYYLFETKSTPEICINVNGFVKNIVETELLSNAPTISEETTNQQYEQLISIFPEIKVNRSQLIDRAGLLKKAGILSNATMYAKENETVIGCKHSSETNLLNSRMFGWAHINAKGNMFLCCDDYYMEYVYGNALEDDITKIWRSDRHTDTIFKAMNSICRSCYCSMRIENEIK